MCCTFEKSEMSKTRIYVGEAEKNGQTVHVVAYQNQAESEGPNAMVLPFPTETAMGPDNAIDTRDFPTFLEDISEASRKRLFAKSSRGLMLGVAGFDKAQVFDSGSYTVVLAEHVKQVPEALKRVPEDRRPRVNVNFLVGYGKLYPKQPIAMCCWNGGIQSEPLLWWYVPTDRSRLFIPTMDAHDGLAPKVGEEVLTDHIISVGSVGPDGGSRVRYSQPLPDDVRELLPTHVHGHQLPRWLENGDCFVKTADLHPSRQDYFADGSKPVELERGFGSQVFYGAEMDGWS